MKPFDTSVSVATHEFLGVRIEQLAVADDLELDPVGLERFARQLGGEHGILGGLAAGGVGQEMDVLGNKIDQAFVVAGEADAPDRGRHHLGAARRDRVEHQLAVGIAGGAEEQARVEFAAGDDERIGHGERTPKRTRMVSHPGARARSRRCRPASAPSAAQAARGTTEPLSATAIPRWPTSTAFSSSRDRERRCGERLVLAVDADGGLSVLAACVIVVSVTPRPRAGANRSMPNGRMAGSRTPSSTRRAIVSAVTGASRMPLR